MKVLFGVLADHANGMQDGRVNTLGIFTVMPVPRVPITRRSMVAVFQLFFEKEDVEGVNERHFELSMQLVNASDANSIIWKLEENVTITIERDPTKEPTENASLIIGPPMPVIIPLFNVEFPDYGKYLLQLNVDGQEVAVVDLYIIQGEVEEEDSPNESQSE